MTYHESSLAMLNCSPRAVTLLKFLLVKADNLTKSSFWRVSKIIAECGFSKSTYHRAIRELVKAGFVTVKERLERCGRQKSNEFIVHLPELSKNQGEVAPAPKVAGYVKLTGMAYKIYLYLQVKCGRNGYRVSNREIAIACGCSVVTVRRYARQLQTQGYIAREAVIREDNSQGYNFYATRVPARIKIQRFIALLLVLPSVLSDTLPEITDDTPLTISKLELDNSKEKKNYKYKIAYRITGFISKLWQSHRRMFKSRWLI